MTEPTEQHPSPCASPKALPKTSSWHAPCKLGTPLREAATQAFSRLQHLLSLPKEPAADASSCAVYDVAGEAVGLVSLHAAQLHTMMPPEP